VGGAHHHVARSIQDDALPGPLVQEQHLALTRHNILASQDSDKSAATETNMSRSTSTRTVISLPRQQTCKVLKPLCTYKD